MNGRIPEGVIQQVRDRLSIREVVADYVTLKRTGANYKGLCPFHKEKTPSFTVHEGMQIFRCFGCGESGNAFGFVMRMDGISFPEAVRKLAARAGVEIPRAEPTPEERQEIESRGRLLKANELAEAFFHRMLLQPAGKPALDYLLGRGLTRELIENYRLGWAADSWEALLRHLETEGISANAAHEAGLVIAKEGGGYYDRFRGRVMFPIRDVSGRTVGFGGRVIGPGEPKYLNSPETALFKKGKGFYGLDRAKDAVRKHDRVVVTEGYLDQIALWQHGIEYAVATLGTALTADHAAGLRRFSRNVFLVYDGDEAGVRASLRSLETFLEEGLTPRVVLMPADQDPDDFIRASGAEAFAARMETAPSLMDFYLERELAAAGTQPAAVAKAVSAIGQVLARMRDPIERGLYARRTAERAGVPEAEVQRRILGPRRAAEPPEAAKEENLRYTPTEESYLYLLLHHPEVFQRLDGGRGVEELDDGELKEFCRALAEQIGARGSADPAVLLHRFSGPGLAGLVSRLALEDRAESPEQAERAFRDTWQSLRLQRIRQEKRLINQAIHQVGNDLARFGELQKRKQDLENQEREMAAAKG